MNTHRLFKTNSFRLSALYLLLILSSFAVLGCAVVFLTGHMLEKQLQDSILSGMAELQESYKNEGVTVLITEINEKENINAWDAPNYAFIDPQGKKLAGSLPLYPYKDGWQTFPGPPEKEYPHELEIIYAYAAHMPSGYWLVVGDDGEYIDDFKETILSAFMWGALLVILLGIPCGIYLSRSFLKKVGSLTSSTQAIIDGDLSHRLLVSPADDELDGLARLINRMLDQINALIENVQQVSNDIAHDLRTPISRLRQHLDAAQHAELSAVQYRDHIEMAIGEIDTILATFSALLRIAQIEAGSRRSGFKDVDLSALVIDVADAFIPVVEETVKVLTTSVSKGVLISGDKELLTQLIFNLIENAVQHTPAGSSIHVTLKGDKEPVLTVADNGAGIPEDARESVFQRFYRVEKSRNTPGNGLGLSIAKAIADLHGLKIDLSDNAPGLKVSIRFSA